MDSVLEVDPPTTPQSRSSRPTLLSKSGSSSSHPNLTMQIPSSVLEEVAEEPGDGAPIDPDNDDDDDDDDYDDDVDDDDDPSPGNSSSDLELATLRRAARNFGPMTSSVTSSVPYRTSVPPSGSAAALRNRRRASFSVMRRDHDGGGNDMASRGGSGGRSGLALTKKTLRKFLKGSPSKSGNSPSASGGSGAASSLSSSDHMYTLSSQDGAPHNSNQEVSNSTVGSEVGQSQQWGSTMSPQAGITASTLVEDPGLRPFSVGDYVLVNLEYLNEQEPALRRRSSRHQTGPRGSLDSNSTGGNNSAKGDGGGDMISANLNTVNNSKTNNANNALGANTSDRRLIANGSVAAFKETTDSVRRRRQQEQEDADLFSLVTVDPVNRFGFPENAGRRVEEQRGPYLYVLTEVRMVHFEEDARYYTVLRMDTRTSCRADHYHMSADPVLEPPDPALRSAMRAARTNARQRRSNAFAEGHYPHPHYHGPLGENRHGDGGEHGPLLVTADGHYYYAHHRSRGRLYRCARTLKRHITAMLMGLRPYSVEITCTGVNFLVCISCAHLLLDQLRLYLASPKYDWHLVVLCAVCWAVLVLEMIFEVLIRPEGYRSVLNRGELKYNPAVARAVNGFHLLCEGAALLAFLPEMQCLVRRLDCGCPVEDVNCVNQCDKLNAEGRSCGEAWPYSLTRASLGVTFGPTRLEVAVGWVVLALLRLRLFGLVRHWKQMWFNRIHVGMDKPGPSGQPHRVRDISRAVSEQIERREQSRHMTRYGGGGNVSLNGSRHTRDFSSSYYPHKAPPPPPHDGVESDVARVSREEDALVKNAANINTALLVINSHRAMLLVLAVVGLKPFFHIVRVAGGANDDPSSTEFLADINDEIPAVQTALDHDCAWLERAAHTWLWTAVFHGRPQQEMDILGDHKVRHDVLWARMLPTRGCKFLEDKGGLLTNSETCSSTVTAQVLGIDVTDTNLVAKKCNLYPDQYLSKEDRASWGQFCGVQHLCNLWKEDFFTHTSAYEDAVKVNLVKTTNKRWGAVHEVNITSDVIEGGSVRVFTDRGRTVELYGLESAVLQFCLLLSVLALLSVLRSDAGRLVLDPLRRMLRIVLHYAKNPLSPISNNSHSKNKKESNKKGGQAFQRQADSVDDDGLDDLDMKSDKLGNFELEQLINAITKITDLLRKCWGVAGANIISSNLARTKDGKTVLFNPCVPGKYVHALFAFAGINDFSNLLRSLDTDVIGLINDFARVLHDEVFRWGLGDSGQCNKNLGSTFLMVYRIGDFEEVREKNEKARNVIFHHNNSVVARNKKKQKEQRDKVIARKDPVLPIDSVHLPSLPGISVFADRAVFGLLKTFAGIHRDRHLLYWQKDLRLGSGVGAFCVDMSFGLHAGWAVEGAVGSEYKIDATYLSPHVNMASRVMSANKQYGVSLMLSEAAQELLSKQAREKVRHLDTVTVKGSSVKQRIYTFDARYKNVDFFLYERSTESADADAERFCTDFWNQDRDLWAMRQHVTKQFEIEFNKGRDLYLGGNWPEAIQCLRNADQIMVKTVVEDGIMEEETMGIAHKILNPKCTDDEEATKLRLEFGDYPSRCLVKYMESRGGVAPIDWDGYRPLTNK